MTVLERIKKLCREKKNISITTLEQTLGYSNGSLAKAKDIPSSRILEIARYLDVSADFLMSGEENASELSARDERDIAKDLESIMAKMRNGDNGPASFEGEEIPEEDLELFAGQLELMLRRLKSINKEKYNPHKNKK